MPVEPSSYLRKGSGFFWHRVSVNAYPTPDMYLIDPKYNTGSMKLPGDETDLFLVDRIGCVPHRNLDWFLHMYALRLSVDRGPSVTVPLALFTSPSSFIFAKPGETLATFDDVLSSHSVKLGIPFLIKPSDTWNITLTKLAADPPVIMFTGYVTVFLHGSYGQY
jgi:hypothetical protein